MNKFELDKVMEIFGLQNADYYEINGCNYYHDGRDFTIVKGKIPYELAILIREKYDNNIYKIRVNGNNKSTIPHGDVYTYHIDTIEGLVAFLLETQDYFSKSQEFSKNFEQTLQLVYSNILQGVNPNMSICDWMLDRENRKKYFKTLLNMNTYLDFKLRKEIEIFDNIVNPFCNNNLDLNSSEFIVTGYGYQDNNWFSLIDKKSRIKMTTTRDKDGFVLRLYVPLNAPYEISFYHCFDKNGERIAFEKYDESGLSRIEYNLTDFSFGDPYEVKHTATAEDKKFIIQNLNKYISLTSDVVKRNISISSTNQKYLKRLNKNLFINNIN